SPSSTPAAIGQKNGTLISWAVFFSSDRVIGNLLLDRAAPPLIDLATIPQDASAASRLQRNAAGEGGARDSAPRQIQPAVASVGGRECREFVITAMFHVITLGTFCIAAPKNHGF
ncbi:MAG: hypothetical protein AB7E21_11545, partial [Pseudodonghicola sp.]